MAYITQSDIESVFGVDNIAAWSNLQNDGAGVVVTRIAAAIAYAEGVVNDRFRDGPYAIPFQGTSGSTPAVVVDWCAKYAGIWLYESRPARGPSVDGLPDMLKRVEADIGKYLAGQRRLAATLVGQIARSPVLVVTEGPSAGTVGGVASGARVTA